MLWVARGGRRPTGLLLRGRTRRSAERVNRTEESAQEARGPEDTAQEVKDSEEIAQEAKDSEGTAQEGKGSEGTAQESKGSEETAQEANGSEGTAQEAKGSEGTAQEAKGFEGTAQEAKGFEGTAQEAKGFEGTAQEAKGFEGTAQEAKGSEGTAQEANGSEGTAQEAKGSERSAQKAGSSRSMDRRVGGQAAGAGAASPRRYQSFPACATEVLEQVTKVCGQQGQKWRGPAALRSNELQHQLDSDLFCISPDRRVSRLNQIQQLRLLQILCDYFNERESEPRGQQYSYFEAIFCGREGEPLLHETRISILISLSSLAVQYPCFSVLNHITQWLHKIGSGKTYAQQFVTQLVDHYIVIPDESALYKYLLPLADEVPEFVSYFVVYSVTKDALRQQLFTVLNHWLTGRRSDLIMSFIKENPAVAQHFASVSFPNLVVYDCAVGGEYKNPLHGFTTMLYADWKITPSLEIKPALEILSKDTDYNSTFAKNTLVYHVHLAKLSKILTEKDLMDILENSESSSHFKSMQDELLKA